jgi:hypothetical protein
MGMRMALTPLTGSEVMLEVTTPVGVEIRTEVLISV